jgi:hypothetical protein
MTKNCFSVDKHAKAKKRFLNSIYIYLFSILFIFPPFHELGHVIICFLTDSTIIEVNWWSYVIHTKPHFFHDVWEFTPMIPIFISLFIFIRGVDYIKYIHKKRCLL